MSELRRRKGGTRKEKISKSSRLNGDAKGQAAGIQRGESALNCWAGVANILLGATIAVVVGVKYALYVRELHENDMWFSNIGVSLKKFSYNFVFDIDLTIIIYHQAFS